MHTEEKKPVLKVDCYSGYRADEKPVSFLKGERKLRIDRIIEQWRSPDFNFFKVRADDGKGYILKNDIVKGHWVLEKIFEIKKKAI